MSITSPNSGKQEAAQQLRQAVGCLCEVRTPANKLIFLGRIQDFDGCSVTVFPTGGKEAPPVIFNDEFKLVLRIPRRSVSVWRGSVRGSTRWFWKLDQLERYHLQELRANFRQPVDLRANVLCVNALYPEKSCPEPQYDWKLCRVLDISLGGLRLQGQPFFHLHDYLVVTDLFLDEFSPRPYVFTVKVRWETIRSRLEAQYGCAFEPMGVREEDRLCAAILKLQREDLSAH